MADGVKPGKPRLLEKDGPEAAAEKRKASVRAKVEHPFLYVKRHFRFAKVRYRGLAKNTQRIALLLGPQICCSPAATRPDDAGPMCSESAGKVGKGKQSCCLFAIFRRSSPNRMVVVSSFSVPPGNRRSPATRTGLEIAT